jgi:hypothetical protein
MSRVTVVTLRAAIAEINGWLRDRGLSVRLETSGRNNYQAVDEYSVNADGSPCGSGVDRNICCGTSRECVSAAYDFWNACARKAGDAHPADSPIVVVKVGNRFSVSNAPAGCVVEVHDYDEADRIRSHEDVTWLVCDDEGNYYHRTTCQES